MIMSVGDSHELPLDIQVDMKSATRVVGEVHVGTSLWESSMEGGS